MSKVKELSTTLAEIDKINLNFRSDIEFSHENFDSVLSNITNFFGQGLESINAIIKGVSNDTNNIDEIELTKELQNILNLDQEMKSIVDSGLVKLPEIANIQIPVILGLKTNILDTVEQLNFAMGNIDKNLEAVIKETDEIIGKTLASKDFRTASRPHITKTNVRNVYFEISNIVSRIIDENSTKDRMKLENFLPSLNSINTVSNEVIKFNKVVNVNFLKSIKKELNKLVERADILYKYIKENDEVLVSKPVLNLVAERLEYTARYATTITTIIYIAKHTMESYNVCLKSIQTYHDKKASR